MMSEWVSKAVTAIAEGEEGTGGGGGEGGDGWGRGVGRSAASAQEGIREIVVSARDACKMCAVQCRGE